METQTNITSAPQLALNDLILALKVIDFCSERGAFKGTELTVIGGLRDRLATFIDETTRATESPQVTAETPTETAPEVAPAETAVQA